MNRVGGGVGGRGCLVVAKSSGGRTVVRAGSWFAEDMAVVFGLLDLRILYKSRRVYRRSAVTRDPAVV